MPDNIATIRPQRPPQENIPQTKAARIRLLGVVRDYVRREKPAGPLSIEELRSHSQQVIERGQVPASQRDYAAVLLNNEVWRDVVARIPYDRRLLLLPKCLRHPEKCRAELDEYGLICAHCGHCIISDLQNQAEQLGYAVLVAEGSPVVMSLIESGQIEAVIGVSCLSVLEQVFPYMSAGAVPGIAIPLLQDGCANTSVDIDWVLDAIYENSEDQTRWLNLEQLRRQVESWFTRDTLTKVLGPCSDPTEQIALDWIAGAGKRYRPFLAVCAYQALVGPNKELPPGLVRAAVAVECFHKASLIHDDIEDGDCQRYGQQTLHAQYGVAVALNVGDLLLGEGYRLLASIDCPSTVQTAMLRAAADGHRELCIGQGKELLWARDPKPITTAEVIEIYKKKTSPAFGVALNLGAILAGGDSALSAIFRRYSNALGIAYQIKDDLDDFDRQVLSEGPAKVRPSLILSLAYENTRDAEKELIASLWRNTLQPKEAAAVRDLLDRLGVRDVASAGVQHHKSEAIAALAALQNPNLKGLLRRVICKIFNDIEVMDCCDDYQARHARRRKPR